MCLASAREAKSAFQRAYSLLGEVPQHPMRGLLLHGFGFVLCLRAEYAEALARGGTSRGALVRDERSGSCAGRVHRARRGARCCRGDRVWPANGSSAGLAAMEPLDVRTRRSFVADPQVTLLGLLAIQLLHLGLVETARTRLQQAHARARQLGQPMARLVAIWFDALFEVRLGNADRVAALADEMRALVDEFAVAQGRIACRWFRGWADARMGDPREGYRQIRGAYEENTRLGMLAGGSEVLGYSAEALLLAGDWEAAQHELEEAFQSRIRTGSACICRSLFLIEAAIARARGESAVALRVGSACGRRGASAGGAMARVDGAARALRTRRCDGRRPAGARRTRR